MLSKTLYMYVTSSLFNKYKNLSVKTRKYDFTRDYVQEMPVAWQGSVPGTLTHEQVFFSHLFFLLLK